MPSDHLDTEDGGPPLTRIELLILLALAEQDRHGYGILKRTRERTGGQTRLEPGNLYRALRRLLKRGFVERTPRPGSGSDARRRYYRLTENGRREATAETARLEQLVRAARLAGFATDPEEAL